MLFSGHSTVIPHSQQLAQQQQQQQNSPQFQALKQSQIAAQQLISDGRPRGGEEILINGGQRSRQPRRHHTIASTEHFNNIMNQTNDHSAVSLTAFKLNINY